MVQYPLSILPTFEVLVRYSTTFGLASQVNRFLLRMMLGSTLAAPEQTFSR